MSRKWKYRLKSGAYLRDIIDDGSNEDTLKALKNCYKEIHKLIPDIYDEDDLENDIEEIDNQLDNCENYLECDMTEEDIITEINYMLRNFYNFCDDNNIWVALTIFE